MIRDYFIKLYGDGEGTYEYQKRRYRDVLNNFTRLFPDSAQGIDFFSAPGRTEIGGNHTDHNGGRVLAAGINLDSIGGAAKSGDSIISLYSQGYDEVFRVDTDNLSKMESERETTTALIRGMAARFKELGYKVGGFNAYITSDVLQGSGLSSSASIEMLIGAILNHLYNEGKVSQKELAMIGQFAENEYFGKPSGLMDQMACALGGLVAIDFADPKNPKEKIIEFDFDSKGYKILVVDTGGSHWDLTADYAAIPDEMKAVARALGQNVCRGLKLEDIKNNVSMLRKVAGDRALLRAIHFIKEDERVLGQVKALEENDFPLFLSLIKESGGSSFKWLQNCYSIKDPSDQGISLALALTEDFIGRAGRGVSRVHGGGFAGTIQVFLPVKYIKEYTKEMEYIFGKGSVKILSVRSHGAIKVDMKLMNIDF